MTDKAHAEFVAGMLAGRAAHPALSAHSPSVITRAPAASRQGPSIEQERRQAYALSALTFVADADADQQ